MTGEGPNKNDDIANRGRLETEAGIEKMENGGRASTATRTSTAAPAATGHYVPGMYIPVLNILMES